MVTLLGTITEVRFIQPENADPSMVVTLSGIVIEVRPVQPENAELPIVETVSGMVKEVRLVQPENALFPMFVRPSVNVTSFRLSLQYWVTQDGLRSDFQIKIFIWLHPENA